MKKIAFFTLCVALLGSCVSKKQYNDMLTRNQYDKDSLQWEINNCRKHLAKSTALEEKLEKNVVSLRADSLSKKRQIENLTSQNAELKQLNANLTNKQSAMIKQQAAESKKTLEELQAAREKLQTREDELDSIQLSLEQERKNLDKIRAELGIKDNEILAKNKQIAEMEEILRKKDSATVALRNKIEKALKGFEGQGLNIAQRDGKIYLVLDESLLFSVGKSDVAPKGLEVLKNLATVLEQNQDINIEIEGHTDNTGGAKINWELSTKRALAISQILLDNSKIDGKRITVSGRGQYCPVDESNTPEARAKNRRSEIILTPDLQELYDILNSKE
ncbi:MAG: OmpA family protein [Bacteroidales bacterium]|nr:OmpA family protein [Bacteroidales bacterium]